MYGFNQHNLTNDYYYEKFNTKFDVGEAIGIIRQHNVIMEYTAQETFDFFNDLSSDEKPELRNDTEEKYLSYIFL